MRGVTHLETTSPKIIAALVRTDGEKATRFAIEALTVHNGSFTT
jgi:hypothetical protein